MNTRKLEHHGSSMQGTASAKRLCFKAMREQKLRFALPSFSLLGVGQNVWFEHLEISKGDSHVFTWSRHWFCKGWDPESTVVPGHRRCLWWPFSACAISQIMNARYAGFCGHMGRSICLTKLSTIHNLCRRECANQILPRVLALAFLID